MKKFCLPFLLTASLAGCGGGGSQNVMTAANPPLPAPASAKSQPAVQVSAPANNATVLPSVQYVATATTSCAAGIGKMAVYTDPTTVAYQVNAGELNTNLNLNPGAYTTTVQAWDNCGSTASVPVKIEVKAPQYPPAPTPPGSKTFSNLQKNSGWTGYGLLPTAYTICTSCSPSGPQVTWSSTQGVTSPSITGSAMQFNLGGQTQFADALWNNHLIGQFSSQGMFDSSGSITSAVHNFMYDVYFYISDLPASQALEFDINQFVNGQSYIWGHECRIAGGNEWDIWDNQGMKWHPTGVWCNPKSNAWNHLVLQVQRTSDGHLLFQSISLNGNTSTLNYYESPTSTSWDGVTINYQMDGNQWQQSYTVYLDQLNFTYW